MLFKTKPNVNHLRIFGCVAYAHIPKQCRRKLDNKSKKLVLVGYSDESKAYRLLDVTTNQITISRDVRFIADDHGDPSEDLAQLAMQNNTENVERDDIDFSELLDSDTETIPVTVNPTAVNDNRNVAEEVPIPDQRVSNRTTKGIPPERFKANKITIGTGEPTSYEEAMQCENKSEWKKAIQEEYKSLLESGTW